LRLRSGCGDKKRLETPFRGDLNFKDKVECGELEVLLEIA
jgi:hypothetical protein